ncbi:MAG: cell division protein FtsQ/DivIB [Microgenomates group bacterium]
MPPAQLSKKFFNKVKIIILFIFLVLFFLNLFLFLENFFKIKEIEVNEKNIKIIGLDSLYGKNIIFLNEEKTVEKLIKNNPSIKNIVISRILPAKLSLSLTFTHPLAQLVVDKGFFYLDDNGKIIEKSKNQSVSLPFLNFYQKIYFDDYQPGQEIFFGEIKKSLYLLKKINQMGLTIKHLDISGNNVIVFNLENKKIIFDSLKDQQLQLYQLGQIIKAFKIKGENYQEIDLRFDKPVVRF